LEAALKIISEDRRISVIGLLIMAVLTFTAGITVFIVMQRQAETILSKGLELSLEVRAQHLIDTVDEEVAKVTTIATRPLLIAYLKKFNADKADADTRAILLRAAQSFSTQGFYAVAFYDREGNEIAKAGEFSSHPELSLDFKTSIHARLIRDKVMVLHADEPILDGGERIASVSTEAYLPSIDKMLSETTNLGKTSELAICAPLQQDMACFQTALTHHVFPRIPREQGGRPLPMSHALAGQSGVIITQDYRNQEVAAAYSPVGDLNLGMVMKVDTDELFHPVRNKLKIVLVILLGLLIAGALILRWRLLPLVQKLIRSEQAARETHDRILNSGAHIRVLTEVSPVGIFLTDANGNCLYVNDRYCEITGLSMPQAIGHGWASALYSEDKERVFNAWYESVRNRLPFSIECRYSQPDGSIIWILAQATSELNDVGEIKGYVGSIIDITEHKHAEEALRQSEERYRSIVTVMAEGIVIQAADQSIVACNPSAERILGLTEDQLMGRSLTDPRWRTVHEDGSPFPNDTYPIVTTLRSGKPESNVIMGVYRPDDSLVWVSINTQPLIRPGEQQPYASVATFIDITDRRRTEEALQKSETRYRNIVELAQEGIWQIDADNCTNFVNKKMADILGFTADEMLGKSLFSFMDDEGKAVTERNIERRRQGMAEEHEFKFFRKDGSEVWAIVNANPLFDEGGGYAGALAMISDITERKRGELALAQSERNFRTLIMDVNIGILVHYLGKHVFANPRLLKMLGYTLEEFRRTSMEDIVRSDEYQKVYAHYKARLAGQSVPNVYETVLQTKDGFSIPVELTSTTTVWEGQPAGLVLFQDITDRQHAIGQMHKLSKAVEQTADAVIITDPKGVIEYVNAAFEHTTGYGRDEVIGQTPSLIKSDRQKPEFYKNLWQTILAGEVYNEVFVNRRKDGSLYYEEKTITPLKDNEGRITHFVSTGKDITERMHIQERLQYMTQHDALTDLPNRVLLFDRLMQALVRARRHNRLLAVLFIDLDRFKNINDTLGHEAGDQLLQQLSARLRRCVREDDTVARFGGDEFVILLDDVILESDINDMAKKVLEELVPPFNIGSQQLYISASIGISLYPNDGQDSSELLKNADVAMYRAKERGKNTYQFYSADMSSRAFERLTLESSLRHAIERNEFRLYYQPQIDIRTGSLIGVEALLRWQHPEFGMVMPMEFMPLLEETGLIVPAGEWVLNTACTQLLAWHDAGWPTLRMAVNLSARQFASESLSIALENALAMMRGDLTCLELEITESVLMQNAQSTIDTMSRLSAMGCRFAIDDFGTGYSSLSYLKRFPISALKIDRSFVRDIPADKDDAAIVTTIVAMAHNLKLQVIAEGVETEEQLGFLRACGCDSMQGYLFSRPLPADEVVVLF
jgi:diguanylate cyclase (GGDEF)-like protein/PAS domain S-box-containing protein